MYSRWYSASVVLLWLATMTWLVTQKVIPTLVVGEPPSYRTIVESQSGNSTECWRIRWNNRELGWAATAFVHLPHEMTEIRSRVHFDEVPLTDMIPDFVQGMVGPVEQYEKQLEGDLDSTLTLDALGGLSRFESVLRLPAVEDFIKVRGSVMDDRLSVWVHTGGMTTETEVPLPRKTMVHDNLSPQARLPGLREGQTWTVEIYSPLRPPNSPLELLRATVDGIQPIPWNGQSVDTWVVVYRSDPGSSVSRANREKGRMWVHPDGTVLRQQVEVLNSTLTFLRMSDQEALALARKVNLWTDDEKKRRP
jgi:hypothetical protein